MKAQLKAFVHHQHEPNHQRDVFIQDARDFVTRSNLIIEFVKLQRISRPRSRRIQATVESRRSRTYWQIDVKDVEPLIDSLPSPRARFGSWPRLSGAR